MKLQDRLKKEHKRKIDKLFEEWEYGENPIVSFNKFKELQLELKNYYEMFGEKYILKK